MAFLQAKLKNKWTKKHITQFCARLFWVLLRLRNVLEPTTYIVDCSLVSCTVVCMVCWVDNWPDRASAPPEIPHLHITHTNRLWLEVQAETKTGLFPLFPELEPGFELTFWDNKNLNLPNRSRRRCISPSPNQGQGQTDEMKACTGQREAQKQTMHCESWCELCCEPLCELQHIVNRWTYCCPMEMVLAAQWHSPWNAISVWRRRKTVLYVQQQGIWCSRAFVVTFRSIWCDAAAEKPVSCQVGHWSFRPASDVIFLSIKCSAN